MSHENVSHMIRISVNGSELHRYGILLASEIASAAGYHLQDMTLIQTSPYRPDLIISKTERFLDGAHRKNMTTTYWIDLVISHDPRREWAKKGLPCDDVIIIDLSDCTLETPIGEIANRIRSKLP